MQALNDQSMHAGQLADPLGLRVASERSRTRHAITALAATTTVDHPGPASRADSSPAG